MPSRTPIDEHTVLDLCSALLKPGPLPPNTIYTISSCLDLSKIPSTPDDPHCVLAVAALNCIWACELRAKTDEGLVRALHSMWSRIWNWVSFLHDNWSRIFVNPTAELTLGPLEPSVMRFLLSQSSIRETVIQTPGVLAMIINLWLKEREAILPEDPAHIRLSKSAVQGHASSQCLMSIIDGGYEAAFEEVSAMDEKKLQQMGKVAVAHVQFTLSAQPLSFDNLILDLTIINYLLGMYNSTLTIALLENDLPRVFMQAYHELAAFEHIRRRTNMACFAVLTCHNIIMLALTSIFSIRWLVEFLKYDLLPVLLQTGSWIIPADEDDFERTKTIFTRLCLYTVFRSVLSHLMKPLKQIEHINITEQAAGPLWPLWLSFKDLAETRITLSLMPYAQQDLNRGCIAEGCPNRDTPAARKCCKCRDSNYNARYCSRACQKRDWCHHREVCTSRIVSTAVDDCANLQQETSEEETEFEVYDITKMLSDDRDFIQFLAQVDLATSPKAAQIKSYMQSRRFGFCGLNIDYATTGLPKFTLIEAKRAPCHQCAKDAHSLFLQTQVSLDSFIVSRASRVPLPEELKQVILDSFPEVDTPCRLHVDLSSPSRL